MQRTRLISNKGGFTLIETIVTITLFSVLSIALSLAIFQFYKVNGYAIAQSAEVQSASRSMQVVIREIREAMFADDGSYPIVYAATSTLMLYSDIDQDNSVEHVEYRLQGTDFYKYKTNATGTPLTYSTTTPDETLLISDHVRNIEEATSTFKYFDNTGTEITGSNITDIRSIEVSTIVNVDPNRNPGLFMLRSHATLRNLKDNL